MRLEPITPQLLPVDSVEARETWFLNELVEKYGYPRRLVTSRTSVNRAEDDAGSVVEVSLLSEQGRPFFVALIGDESYPVTHLEGALKQRMASANAAHLGVFSNGVHTRVLAKSVNTGTFDYLSDIPEYRPARSRGKEKAATATRDFKVLLTRAHNLLRAVDGLRDDQALDELCKLLFTKVYTEQKQAPPRNFAVRGNAEETAAAVRDLYDAARKSGNGRSLWGAFAEEIKLSSAAVSGVIELLAPTSLSQIDADVLGQAFQQLTRAAARSGMGQFFTPEPVAGMTIAMLNPSPTERVLDPFCGSGLFLAYSIEHVRRLHGVEEANTWAGTHVFGIEKDPRMVRVAQVDMMMYGDARPHVLLKDSLLDFVNYPKLKEVAGDEYPEMFDVVATNPPFGALLDQDATARLGTFELSAKDRDVALELLGLERSIQFLRPGGRIGIVLPSGIFTDTTKRLAREYVLDHCYLDAVVSLPVQTFLPYKGVTKASVLFATKKGGSRRREAAFFAVSRGVGYDSTFRPVELNDLPDIAASFSCFVKDGRTQSAFGFVADGDFASGMSPEQLSQRGGFGEWESRKLSDLCARIYAGATPARAAYTDAGHRMLKFRNITNEGIDWSLNDRGFIGTGLFAKHADKRVVEGDIVLGSAAHNPEYIGKKVDIIDYIPPEYQNGVLPVAEVLVIRVDPDLIDPYYVLMYLRSTRGYSALQSCVRGQTAHLYAKDLAEIDIPIPPDDIWPQVQAALREIRDSLPVRRDFEQRHEAGTTAFRLALAPIC